MVGLVMITMMAGESSPRGPESSEVIATPTGTVTSRLNGGPGSVRSHRQATGRIDLRCTSTSGSLTP
jgi:hypothetical protein